MTQQQEWRRRLRRARAARDAADAASDTAFAALHDAIRAARRAGRTVPHLVTMTGLSKPRVDGVIEQGGELVNVPHSDADLRIAAYTAAAAVGDYLAARSRRDALILQAGMSSGLGYGEIAAESGVSRREEWELRTGRLGVDRRSPRQDVFEGAGIDAYRTTANTQQRDRRQALQAGAEVTVKHGLTGYRHGCRCEVCLSARRAVREGTVEVKHGPTGYRHGCRCEVCQEWHATYHWEWRLRRKQPAGR